MKGNNKSSFNYPDLLWDMWCVSSIIGIWPRYIEPQLLRQTRLQIAVPRLSRDLKVVLFTDLHLHPAVKESFLNKILVSIEAFKPDLVFFGGDFICDGVFSEKQRLIDFFKRIQAPLGVFGVLGNHDYSEPVSINDQGDYDVTEQNTHFKKAFGRLFTARKLSCKITERAKAVKNHDELMEALKKTPLKLLHNESFLVEDGDLKLNIVGLGEYVLGRALPEVAFKGYHQENPGIILVHNPDMIPKLENYPGEIIFSGHTHGGQVNLPWVWKKLTMMEDLRFKEGRITTPSKTAYVSRGVGSVKPFRWNASPEIVLMELKHA